MNFADAHIHLSDEQYAGVVEEVLHEGTNSGLVALVSNSVDLKTCRENLKLSKDHPGIVYVALGVHPWGVKSLQDGELDKIAQLISRERSNESVVALGEIGLDSKYMEIWDNQVEAFDLMLQLAEKFGLPVIVHSRGATVQVVDMLSSYKVKRVLLHWFSSPMRALEKAVEKGYYFSEGPATVYSDDIREVVKRVPLTNLLTETDGPVRFFKKPFEGRKTTSCFIPVVISAFAEVKKASVEEVAIQLLKNFQNFFEVNLIP